MRTTTRGRAADSTTMSGIGIGTSVGLGAMIGAGIVAPNADVIEYITTFAFYGFISGFIFESYRLAFTYKHPFSRR